MREPDEKTGGSAGLQDSRRFLTVTFRRALLPAMLSVGGVMISTLADSLVAGNFVGGSSLAVLSVVSPIYYVFATIGSLAGAGASSVAAWCVGQDDREGCDAAVTLAALLSLGLSLALALAGLAFLSPLVSLLGARGELAEPVRQYAAVYLFCGVGIAGIYPPYFLLKLEGRHRQSGALFLGLAAACGGLELLFVLAFGMGLRGVALGCTLANVGTALAGWGLLLRGSFHLCGLSKVRARALRFLTAGSPAALNNLCGVLRTVALNLILAAQAGELGLSAFSVVSMAANLSLIPINGLSQTTAPFVGVFTSERDCGSLRQIESQALRMGLALSLPFAAALAALAGPFSALFGAGDNPMALSAVVWFALSIPFTMLSTILMNYYLSAGRTWLANLLTLCRSYALIVPCAALLSRRMGVSGVFLSMTLAEVLSWAVLAAALAAFRRTRPGLSGLLLLDRRYEESGQAIAFSVHSRVEEILEASRRISSFCEENVLDPKRSMLISLSLEEMLVSIKEHSFPGEEDQDISIRILIVPGEEPQGRETIVLRIRCSGAPFNPIDYYERRRQSAAGSGGLDLLDSLDDSLGVAMIAAAASSVDYKTTFGVNNLTVTL